MEYWSSQFSCCEIVKCSGNKVGAPTDVIDWQSSTKLLRTHFRRCEAVPFLDARRLHMYLSLVSARRLRVYDYNSAAHCCLLAALRPLVRMHIYSEIIGTMMCKDSQEYARIDPNLDI